MRTALLLLLALHITSALSAQDFETEEYIKQIICDTTEHEAMREIPRLFKQNRAEEVLIQINDWQEKCGMNEMICITHTFFDLITGYYADTIPDEDVLLCLLDYIGIDRDTTFSKVKHILAYEKFLKEETAKLDSTTLNQDELFIRAILMGNHNLNALKDTFRNSKVVSNYKAVQDSLDNLPEFRWGVFGGAFVPLGKNKLFGRHTTLGLNIDYTFRSHRIGFEVDYKMGRSKEEYTYFHKDKATETDHFGSFLFSAFYGKRVSKFKNNSLWLRSGIGYELIEVLAAEDLDGDGESDTKGKYLRSLNLNFGLQYDVIRPSGFGWNLAAIYNITNYHNTDGTDISGNYLLLRLGLQLSMSEKYMWLYDF